MSKRTKVVFKTKEAEALRKLRELKGLSVRKVGDVLGISHTMVSHLELGRANISEEYIQKYLKSLELSSEDWKIIIEGSFKKEQVGKIRLIQECKYIIQILPEDKLRIIQTMLTNLLKEGGK